MSEAPHVLFSLAADEGPTFALPVAVIAEVVSLPGPIVAVPLAPVAVRGIINHAGRIITLVDPALFVGLTAQPEGGAQALVLRRPGTRRGALGLLVQRVFEIVSRPALQPVEDAQPGPCVGWIARVEQRLIHVLDLEPLLQGLSHQFRPREPVERAGADG